MSSGSNADFTWFMLSAMLNTIESEIVCGTKSFLVRGDEGDGGGDRGGKGEGDQEGVLGIAHLLDFLICFLRNLGKIFERRC